MHRTICTYAVYYYNIIYAKLVDSTLHYKKENGVYLKVPLLHNILQLDYENETISP